MAAQRDAHSQLTLANNTYSTPARVAPQVMGRFCMRGGKYPVKVCVSSKITNVGDLCNILRLSLVTRMLQAQTCGQAT